MTAKPVPAVWFPASRTGSGVDVFTTTLVDQLHKRGIRAEISWLPHRAEYLPWSVIRPVPPHWANIVHANTWLHLRFVPAHLPVVATMHLCVHDESLLPYKSRLQNLYHRAWIKPMETRLLRRAQRVVAVSAYTAARAKVVFSTAAVDTIYNGVPVPSYDQTTVGRCQHSPFRVGYVGNWSSRKGVDLLTPIMEKLGPGFELFYTADSHGRHETFSRPGNSTCVGRLGSKALDEFYRGVDVLLFPTRLEGFGLVAVEAMMQGLPVVASRSAVLSEVINHGVTGLLCEQDNVEEHVEAIRHLAANPALRTDMSKAASLDVRDRFAIDRMTERYVEAYQSLLSDQESN